MVEKFDKIKDYSVIPKLKPFNEISLSDGDTLAAFMDEKWDINDAQDIYDLLKKTFPENKILILLNGIELGVIKHNE